MLIPCYNEEKLVEACLLSCFGQTRPADEIIVVDDASTDDTFDILKRYEDRIKLIRLSRNSGNKSFAQQYGLQYVMGDIFITVDADSILDKHLIERLVADFSDTKVAAVSGYIKSLKYNWLTACRALDYVIGQNIYKLAQSYVNFLFVIPGTAGGFRTDVFKKYITFDHDTITEDLDFTYKLHHQGFKIKYNRDAVVYTLDPINLNSYINQMRRWYGGGWQNLLKHIYAVNQPTQALQLSLIYIEGLLSSSLLILIPLLNLYFFLKFLFFCLVMVTALGLFAALKEKRKILFVVSPLYLIIIYINAWIFLEQFFSVVLLRRKKLFWFQAKRIKI